MNKNQFNVSGTADEWQILVNLINAAVKATGLEGAKAGVIWAERIQKASNDSQSPQQISPTAEPVADVASS